MKTKPLLLRARTVVPDPASEIEDGAVLVHGDRVARVGRFAALRGEPARVHDLGEVALLPGLVNAHAHLDLTGARGRFAPTADFPGWIEGLIALRREIRPGVAAAAEEGARELLRSGCTLAGDVVAEPGAVAGLRRSGIRARAFFEVIGIVEEVPGRGLGDALREGAALAAEDPVAPGLGPHTPYTCSAEILRRCADAARSRGWPATIHLLETRHEIDFLERGEGVFAPSLREWGGPSLRHPGVGPVEHLRRCGFLDGPRLLAHGNWLEAGEMDLLRDGGHVVVHCPGSHAFFGHGRHPVAALRAAGVAVALGTDSLASHPDGVLSLPGELRRLAAREPSIPPRELLAMATVNGAEGLGLAGLAGVLAPGAFADAAAFAVPGGWKGPQSLLDPDLRCSAVFVGGVSRLDTKGSDPRA